MLTLDRLVKSYGARRAVDGVSFAVARGETVGLIGPNGAGKSTTVALVCGLLRADAGTVMLDGEPVAPGASAVKRRIGLVPQELALYDDLSAHDNLALFGALYGLGRAPCAARAAQVLAQVGLAGRGRDKVRTYSGGMKRRLNIAGALMHDPQLLVLDEPTVGVDPHSRNAIFDTLEQLKAEGRSLIYTSHYMEEVERLADRIVVLDHGKVLADETPLDLYRRLPAHAALDIELAEAASDAVLAGVQGCAGVTSATRTPAGIAVRLADAGDAVGVIAWLARHGVRAPQFATARTSLEEVFLNLTGRSLRD